MGKPIPPKIINRETVINNQLWLVITIGFPKLPESVEKPALQKAEIEWKAAKASSPSKVIPSVPWMLNQIEIMPIPSITNVNPKIYNNVDNKEPSELELTISRTTN